MRMNEDVDPRMKGMEYRDCAKGAHMTPVETEDQRKLRLVKAVMVERGWTPTERINQLWEILTGSRN